MCLACQLLTGFVLACWYCASAESAFDSVAAVSWELDAGVLLRGLHANGASVFFMCVYGHLIRCLLASSSASRGLVWFVGVVLWLLLSGACFTGYSLVYGQMSLWALVVICSLVTALPVIGVQVLELLWGGSTVSGVTVNRVFGLHFILPLVLLAAVLVHLVLLHLVNSVGDTGFLLLRSDRVNF